MRKIIVVLHFGLFSVLYSQQDAQYNTWLFNQLVINPAYSGMREVISVMADYRKQWVNFPGAPSTGYISVNAPVKKYHLGLGLEVLNDRIGAKNTSGAYTSFAYILKLSSKWNLSFGLRTGFLNYQFNFNKLEMKDQIDHTMYQLNNISKNVFDIDAGIYAKTRSFYVGLSFTHLTKAKVIDKSIELSGTKTLVYSLQPHSFLVIGKSFFINNNFLLNINLLNKDVQNKTNSELSLNTLLMQRLWLGIFVRENYGGGILTQVLVTPKFRIGYSYDVGGGIRRNLGAAHEIMIGWDIKSKNNTTVVSPRFL